MFLKDYLVIRSLNTFTYRDPEGRYAWEKIVFGSDVPYNEIEDVMNDYQK